MPYKDLALRRAFQQEYQKHWRERNRARIKASQKNWREKNPEKVSEKNRKYRLAHLAYERERDKKWKAANPDKVAFYAYRRTLLRKYGLSIETYHDLLAKQKHCCAICQKKFNESKPAERACVDHCGKGGHVRSLLCTKCNSGVAMFHHSAEITRRAVQYLSDGILFNGQ